MRVVTPVSTINPYVMTNTRNRQAITRNKNYNRCCYLLNNGQRCKNPSTGLTKIGNGKSIYVMQCRVHGPVCRKKYVAYKSICAKVINSVSGLKAGKVKKGGNLFAQISNVKDCADQRVAYPKRCVGGCMKFPGSREGAAILKKRDGQHKFIADKLKNLEKKLLYGDRVDRSPNKRKNIGKK